MIAARVQTPGEMPGGKDNLRYIRAYRIDGQ